jgi:hypothetical protein
MFGAAELEKEGCRLQADGMAVALVCAPGPGEHEPKAGPDRAYAGWPLGPSS